MASALGYPVSMLMLIAGTALVIAEALIPGAHFIVIGAALLITGLLGVLTPIGGSLFALTATLLVSGGVVFLAYRHLGLYSRGHNKKTSDSDTLVGVEGVVTSEVTGGKGRVELDKSGGFSSTYEARTEEGALSEGTRVIVVDGRGGSVVEVASIEEEE